MSNHAFASLCPANALARLAFSDIYESLTSRCQNSHADNTRAALKRMVVKPEQACDQEIISLRREMARTKYDTDGEASDSLTELDADAEKILQGLGMILVGSYQLELDSPPAVPERGWALGKGHLENMDIDLLLCTRAFAKIYDLNLRNPHARFNFDCQNKGFFIVGCSKSSLAQLSVNGDPIERQPYYLNQHSMKIQVDKLEYYFQWTDAATGDRFKIARKQYVAIFHKTSGADIDFEMPTPLPTKRTIGKWTLGDALGKGGEGRVFFASDSSGNMAVIKVVERTSRNLRGVTREIQILREVTEFARKHDDDERLLRMMEVIYSQGEKFLSSFDNVAMILQLIAHHTFDDLIGSRSSGGYKGMTVEAATAFRDSLLGVKVMHDEHWMYRDLKPSNIGLVGKVRSVLLDVGTSWHLEGGRTLQPDPGQVGTVNYLAPEFELENYDYSIDIWAIGIILFQLCRYNYSRKWWNGHVFSSGHSTPTGWISLFIEHHSRIGLAPCTDVSIEYLEEPSLRDSLRIKHQHYLELRTFVHTKYINSTRILHYITNRVKPTLISVARINQTLYIITCSLRLKKESTPYS